MGYRFMGSGKFSTADSPNSGAYPLRVCIKVPLAFLKLSPPPISRCTDGPQITAIAGLSEESVSDLVLRCLPICNG